MRSSTYLSLTKWHVRSSDLTPTGVDIFTAVCEQHNALIIQLDLSRNSVSIRPEVTTNPLPKMGTFVNVIEELY